MQSQLASAWQVHQPGHDPFALHEPEHEPRINSELEEENAAYKLPEPFSAPEFEENDALSTQSLAASAHEDAPSSRPSRSLTKTKTKFGPRQPR